LDPIHQHPDVLVANFDLEDNEYDVIKVEKIPSVFVFAQGGVRTAPERFMDVPALGLDGTIDAIAKGAAYQLLKQFMVANLRRSSPSAAAATLAAADGKPPEFDSNDNAEDPLEMPSGTPAVEDPLSDEL
jgi:hypothetical protein